jgi:hypothetical protein
VEENLINPVAEMKKEKGYNEWLAKENKKKKVQPLKPANKNKKAEEDELNQIGQGNKSFEDANTASEIKEEEDSKEASAMLSRLQLLSKGYGIKHTRKKESQRDIFNNVKKVDDELGNIIVKNTIPTITKKPIDFTPHSNDCDWHKKVYGDSFPWSRDFDLEQSRIIEIKQYLHNNPEITQWVAVDDLKMGKTGLYYGMEFEHDYGLENFVETPRGSEGIKQTGIREKILNFLS